MEAFYARLKSIQDRHRAAPVTLVQAPMPTSTKIKPKAKVEDDEQKGLDGLNGGGYRPPGSANEPAEVIDGSLPLGVNFSGEEGFGQFLDFQPLYLEALSSGLAYALVRGQAMPKDDAARLAVVNPEYREFLEVLPKLDAVPLGVKQGQKARYSTFLTGTLDYLLDWIARSRPLLDSDSLLKPVVEEFEANWKDEVGKEDGDGGGGAGGADGDKKYCPDCDHMYKKTVYASHLNGKRHKKAAAARAAAGGSTATKKGPGFKDLALLEAKIKGLLNGALATVLEETLGNVERKQAQTVEEADAEADAEAGAGWRKLMDSDDEEDEEEKLYNPKNVPLGWDGKPIPYWLYKLHGLNHEYKCEICGGEVYKGPRNFEKHFQEWKHEHGMKCLGIPNTRHFHGITTISGAKQLHGKLQKEQDDRNWDPKDDEEFEDSEGNVLNRKTYQDLARQGLL